MKLGMTSRIQQKLLVEFPTIIFIIASFLRKKGEKKKFKHAKTFHWVKFMKICRLSFNTDSVVGTFGSLTSFLWTAQIERVVRHWSWAWHFRGEVFLNERILVITSLVTLYETEKRLLYISFSTQTEQANFFWSTKFCLIYFISFSLGFTKKNRWLLSGWGTLFVY